MTQALEIRKISKKRKPHFIRKDSYKISRIGKRRKKEQKWRRPRGRHSKLRARERNYLKVPSIGYSSPREVRGSIEGKMPFVVYNVNDFNRKKENQIVVIGKVGMKKKIELVEFASSKNIPLANIDTKKFMEKIKSDREIRKKEKDSKKADEKKKESKEIKEKAEASKAEEKK